jgi:hypothetical protein
MKDDFNVHVEALNRFTSEFSDFCKKNKFTLFQIAPCLTFEVCKYLAVYKYTESETKEFFESMSQMVNNITEAIEKHENKKNE